MNRTPSPPLLPYVPRCFTACAHVLIASAAAVLPMSGGAQNLDLTQVGNWPPTPFYNGLEVALSGGHAFVTDFVGGIFVFDPAGPVPFSLVGAAKTLSATYSISVSGRLAVVQESSRLLVVDVADPTQPVIRGAFHLPNGERHVTLGSHVYALEYSPSSEDPSTELARLVAVSLEDPTNPRRVGECSLSNQDATTRRPMGLAGADGVLCVVGWKNNWPATYTAILKVVDIRNPSAPRWVGSHEMPGQVNPGAVAVSGNHALWAPYTINSAGTRISALQVLDLSQPASPIVLGTNRIVGEVKTLAPNGRYLYSGKDARPSPGEFRASIDVLDLVDASKPVRVGGYTTSASDYEPGLSVEGNLLVMHSNSGLTSFDLSDPANLRRLGTRESDYGANDVAVSGDRAYIGTPSGRLQILDIREPEKPALLGSFKVPTYLWRVAAAGNFVYVASEESGVQTIDATDPAHPQRTSVFRGTDRFHNLAVSGNLLAAVGYEGLFLLDLGNPAKPSLRGRSDVRYMEYREKAVAISGRHVLVTSSDDLGSKTGVVEVFDVGDPSTPQWVGSYETSFIARDLATSGHIAVVTGYTEFGRPGTAEVLDLSDPTTPVRLSSFPTWGYTLSLFGERAYLAGPEVVDLHDPAHPRRLGGVIVGSRFAVAGEYLLAACGISGTAFFRMAPETLRTKTVVSPEGETLALTVQDPLTWVATVGNGLQAFDFSRPDSPALPGGLPLEGRAQDVVISNQLAYIAAGESGVVVADLRTPSSPSQLAVLDTPGDARAVLLRQEHLYVADYGQGVQVVDVRDPAAPRLEGGLLTPGWATGLAEQGGYLFAACREAGLLRLDLGLPSQPKLVGQYQCPGVIEAVAVRGTLAYIADGLDGFAVIDWSDPIRPRRRGLAPGRTRARHILLRDRFAYVADARGGVRAYDISDADHPREAAGTTAVDAYRLAPSATGILAASGLGGLSFISPVATPLRLAVRMGVEQGQAILNLEGPPGTTVRLQRATQLGSWQDWQTLTFGESPTVRTDSIGTRDGRAFYRLVSP